MATVDDVCKYLENVEHRLAAVEKRRKFISDRQEIKFDVPSGDEVRFPIGSFSEPPIVVVSAQVETYSGQGESLSGYISITVGRVTENGFRYIAKRVAEPPNNAKLYICWIATEA